MWKEDEVHLYIDLRVFHKVNIEGDQRHKLVEVVALKKLGNYMMLMFMRSMKILLSSRMMLLSNTMMLFKNKIK